MADHLTTIVRWSTGLLLVVVLAACGDPDLVPDEHYTGSDRLFEMVDSNVAASERLDKLVEIDHSRLGIEAGSVMPPARVIIFSDPELEARLVAINPLVAIDLPLRILAYESIADQESRVTFNTFDYLRSRYGLDELPELEAAYASSMADALAGVPVEAVSEFTQDNMQPDGITSLESPFDFGTTVERVVAAINAQEDTVWFGQVDFQLHARELGIQTGPARLLLFGAPAPGAKAMAKAPTLGLDAFCQKFLVWQDDAGQVRLSFNDLLDIAARQDVPKSIALRVVNRRIKETFSEALEEQ